MMNVRRKLFYDQRNKNKRSDSVKNNIAHHPFVLTAMIAAITLVVMVIIFQLLHSIF